MATDAGHTHAFLISFAITLRRIAISHLLESSLNTFLPKQLPAADEIFAVILRQHFLSQWSGGTGKTFLYNTLRDRLRSEGTKIVLCS
jgi:hypothetical protein